MKIIIGTLFSILAVFPNHIELIRQHREDAIHPLPIQLNVHHYERFLTPGVPEHLPADTYRVGTHKEMDHEYVIGIFLAGHLFPFMAPRADLHYNFGKVKIRINGNNASEIEPILDRDRLNSLFCKPFGPENIRLADIHEQ